MCHSQVTNKTYKDSLHTGAQRSVSQNTRHSVVLSQGSTAGIAFIGHGDRTNWTGQSECIRHLAKVDQREGDDPERHCGGKQHFNVPDS